MSSKASIGVVVIGRNEGERLDRCLRSVIDLSEAVVYVDSGSTDGSVKLAEDLGALVVNLDTSIPFTAGRARNEGFALLRERFPDIQFVQFVDGDCEVVDGWLEKAHDLLTSHAEVAVVCGFRVERHREASKYNTLCDMEWQGPTGEIRSSGGDTMMRADAFEQVQGFRLGLIAGEEPELCKRLRNAGWKIFRLDERMTLHDAAMTRFSQWWKRATRAGHAYMECAWIHRKDPERFCVRESLSNIFWGVLLPLLAFGLAWPTKFWSLLLLLAYVRPFIGARKARLKMGDKPSDARIYAWSCTFGKVPEALGALRYFWRHKVLRKGPKIIEYKGPEDESRASETGPAGDSAPEGAKVG